MASRIVFPTYVLAVKEEFDDIAIKLEEPIITPQGEIRHELVKRSRGFYISLAGLGIRICIGSKLPVGLEADCEVELSIALKEPKT